MTSRLPDGWEGPFADVPAMVFIAVDLPRGWQGAADLLTEAFRQTREALRTDRPVVYVVRTDDLLGRRGAPAAMVATGLLSGARTAAIEGMRAGVPANVLAIDDEARPEDVARWARRLSEGHRPTGELIHLGSGHLGKTPA